MAEEALSPHLSNITAYEIFNLYWTNHSFEKPSKLPDFKNSYSKSFKGYKVDWFDDWRTGLITLKSAKRFNYAKINDFYYFLDVDKYLGVDAEERLIRYKVVYDVWVNDILLGDIQITGVLAKTLDLDLVYRERANVTPITQGCNGVRYIPVQATKDTSSFYIPPSELVNGRVKPDWLQIKITSNFRDALYKFCTPYLNKAQVNKEGEFWFKGVELPRVKTWQYEVISTIDSWLGDRIPPDYRITEIKTNELVGFAEAYNRKFRIVGAPKHYTLAKSKGKETIRLSTTRVESDNKVEMIDLSNITNILSISPIVELTGENTTLSYLGRWKEKVNSEELNYYVVNKES